MNIIAEHKDEIYYCKMEGHFFSITDLKWQLNKEISLVPSDVTDRLPEVAKEGYLYTLAHFTTEFSPGYVYNIHRIFYKLVSSVSFDVIDSETILKFNALLPEKANYGLYAVKSFIRKWLDFGYDGVHSSALSVLEKIKIETTCYGDNVKRRDPDNGPFTDDEMSLIIRKVEELFHLGKIDLSLYCFIHLLIYTGRRPLQLTTLRIKDLIRDESEWRLRIPRIKQGLSFRASFEDKVISEHLYHHLDRLSQQTISYLEKKLNVCLSNRVKGELPIFISRKIMKTCNSQADLDTLLVSDLLHAKNEILAQRMKKMTNKYEIISTRTNKPIHLHPRRFRYTLGTQMAKDGASVSVIARALDHSSVSSAGIYIKNTPDNVKDIDDRMSLFLAPLSKVFLGADTVFNSRKFTEIVNHAFGIKPEAEKTIKCFECKLFRPWTGETE